MLEACIPGEMAQGGATFFLVSTPDRVGAIQTRHHLLRWGEGVHEETTCVFCRMLGPVQEQ